MESHYPCNIWTNWIALLKGETSFNHRRTCIIMECRVLRVITWCWHKCKSHIFRTLTNISVYLHIQRCELCLIAYIIVYKVNKISPIIHMPITSFSLFYKNHQIISYYNLMHIVELHMTLHWIIECIIFYS